MNVPEIVAGIRRATGTSDHLRAVKSDRKPPMGDAKKPAGVVVDGVSGEQVMHGPSHLRIAAHLHNIAYAVCLVSGTCWKCQN